jgi:hypothetical protein
MANLIDKTEKTSLLKSSACKYCARRLDSKDYRAERCQTCGAPVARRTPPPCDWIYA